MNNLSGNIVPFYGTDMFTLYMTLNDVKKVLKMLESHISLKFGLIMDVHLKSHGRLSKLKM